MWEKIKKDKQCKRCHNQRKHFSQVCSFGGRNGREGSPILALSTELSHGRENGRTPFKSMGVGNGRIAIAVARSYSRMIRGAWIPSPLQEQEPGCDPDQGSCWQVKLHVWVTPRTQLKIPPTHTWNPPPPPHCAPLAVPRVET